MRKAKTAVFFQGPTKALEEEVTKGGRTALLPITDFMPLEGGIPIVVDGKGRRCDWRQRDVRRSGRAVRERLASLRSADSGCANLELGTLNLELGSDGSGAHDRADFLSPQPDTSRPCPCALIAALFVAPTLVLWLGNSTSPMALGVLTYSLIYGGAPYVALALWAAWSFGEKTEPQIRRVILTLPLFDGRA
jgi:hypothetical protein